MKIITATRLVLVTLLIYTVLKVLFMLLSIHGDTLEETNLALREYFSEEDIANGIEYSIRGIPARFVGLFLNIALTLFFLFSPLVVTFERKLSSRIKGFRGDWIAVLLAFFLGYKAVMFVVYFPLRYYWGYYLEHQFNFSNMDFLTWFVRTGKYFIVGYFETALFVVLSFFIIKFFKRSWVYVASAIIPVFGLVVIIIYPYVITPIFYDYGDIQDEDLRGRILELSSDAGIKVQDIYTINAGKFSNHTNAYFIGVGLEKRIVLYDNLIEKHTHEEILTILAHEIGHWKMDHVLWGIFLAAIGTFIFLLIFKRIYPWFQSDHKLNANEITSPSSLPFIFFVLTITNFFTSPINSGISRYFEKQADAYSLELYNNTEAYRSTYINMARQNKSRLNPHPFIVFWYYSHPPTIQRIKRGVSPVKRNNIFLRR